MSTDRRGQKDQKVALVTGGAIRLGRAIALELGRCGFKVVVHHRQSTDEAEQTVADIEALGVPAVALAADLTREEEIVSLFEVAQTALGRIDLLVNSAGTYGRVPLAELTSERIDAFHALNLRAPLLCIREAVRHFPGGVGSVVNITDIAALVPWRGFSAYSASKAALCHATRCLALELAPKVRVNAVAPGPVLLPASASRSMLDALARKVPLQRAGDGAKDVAQAVAYLATASYVTGHVLPVDGGLRFSDDGREQVCAVGVAIHDLSLLGLWRRLVEQVGTSSIEHIIPGGYE